MNPIQMIALDIDGTILPFGGTRIPDRILRALSRALEAGIEIVPASGRILWALPEELVSLPGVRCAITCNGAAVTDLVTGTCLYRRSIPEGQAAEILRMLTSYDVYTCAYLPDGPHNWGTLPPQIEEQYRTRLRLFHQSPHEDLADYVENSGQPVDKIFVAVFQPEERDRIRRELSGIPGIHVTSSSDKNLEINQVDADKGRALSWLSRDRGIPAESILAMGDNENDYTMLTFAGTAVVPANATDVIRETATEIVPDCRLCGAAVYLERTLLPRAEEARERTGSPKGRTGFPEGGTGFPEGRTGSPEGGTRPTAGENIP